MNNILTKINKLLSSELTELDELIKKNVFGDNDLLNNIIKYTQKTSGKRIRILLALLCGKIYGYNSNSIVKIAAAIELIHNATLLHDDVIDSNTKRRGIQSANRIWNNKTCILAGDFLLSKAFYMISSVNNSRISMLFSQASSILIEGEINQLLYNKSENLDFKSYISIIESKTASLFSLAAIIGAIFAKASEEEIEALKNFGHYIGIAFQITDDLLDYLGTTKILGKPLGMDYKDRKMTLPTIMLKKFLQTKNLNDIWDKEIWINKKRTRKNLSVTIQYIKKYHINIIVEQYAHEYIELAKSSLSKIKHKQPFYDILIEMIDFVAQRNV